MLHVPGHVKIFLCLEGTKQECENEVTHECLSSNHESNRSDSGIVTQSRDLVSHSVINCSIELI